MRDALCPPPAPKKLAPAAGPKVWRLRRARWLWVLAHICSGLQRFAAVCSRLQPFAAVCSLCRWFGCCGHASPIWGGWHATSLHFDCGRPLPWGNRLCTIRRTCVLNKTGLGPCPGRTNQFLNLRKCAYTPAAKINRAKRKASG